MSKKKVVHYVETILAPIVGAGAIVIPIDHPGNNGLVSNHVPVMTSKVLKVHGDLGFETLNSEYRKSGGEER